MISSYSTACQWHHQNGKVIKSALSCHFDYGNYVVRKGKSTISFAIRLVTTTEHARRLGVLYRADVPTKDNSAKRSKVERRDKPIRPKQQRPKQLLRRRNSIEHQRCIHNEYRDREPNAANKRPKNSFYKDGHFFVLHSQDRAFCCATH
jgi:hypothetical protein